MRGQPGGRAAAPDRLAVVQAFVNSVNVEFGPDEFADVDRFAGWLRRNGLGRMRPDELDRRDAVALREALRALLRENNGGPPDPAARRTIEHISRGCPLMVGFAATPGQSGQPWTPGAPGAPGQSGQPGEATRRPTLRPVLTEARGALATMLAAVTESVIDGTWPRLKACREHRCEWAFYDRSRNRGSRWCSMDVCGVRAKMRVYRDSRRAGERAPAPEPAG